MPILAILYMGGNGSSHSIHETKEVGPQSTKRIDSRHKGGGFLGGYLVYLFH